MFECKDLMTCYMDMCLSVQVTRPVPFPCFGVLKKEKHVLLSSVSDVVVEQGAVFFFASFLARVSYYLFWVLFLGISLPILGNGFMFMWF